MSKRPALRFEGCMDDWIHCEFKNCFALLKSNTLSRAELNYEQGEILNVHYGDILVKFGEVIDPCNDRLPYITDTAKGSNSTYLQNGDLIIADTAEDSSVGKCAEITEISNISVVSGLHTIPCRPYERFAKGYLGYLMNSPAYHNQLLPLMQGTKVTSISKSALQDTVLHYPHDKREQADIGCLFMNLDKIITLQQHEYDKLVTYKKAMLEKMFPKDGADVPEVRFAGYTGVWKRHKLSEILIQRIEHQTITSDAPLLAFSYAEGVINPEDKKTNKRDFIMTDKFSKIFSRTELNDIIYNPANVIHGAIHRNKLGTGVVSPIYKIFICNGVNPKYMGERLHTDKFIREISKYIEGTVVKLRTLSPEMFLDMVVEVPQCYAEQEKIGEFFEHLNVLIADHERRILKLKDIKAALLDNMFI